MPHGLLQNCQGACALVDLDGSSVSERVQRLNCYKEREFDVPTLTEGFLPSFRFISHNSYLEGIQTYHYEDLTFPCIPRPEFLFVCSVCIDLSLQP